MICIFREQLDFPMHTLRELRDEIIEEPKIFSERICLEVMQKILLQQLATEEYAERLDMGYIDAGLF